MDVEILKQLGLIDNEVKVYLLLLKRGPSLASDVAKETGLHRTHAYDILKSLVEKSIVGYVVRENRKYFSATEPEHLESLLKDKEDELKQTEEKLKGLIGELKAISFAAKPELNVIVFQGKKGFRALLEDILRRKLNYHVIGYNPTADEYLKHFLPGFTKARIKEKISRKAIVDPVFKGGSWVEKQKLQEIRFFKYNFPMGIIIYGNRIVMSVIQETGQVAIVIENQKVADNFRKLFEELWVKAEK